MSTSRSNLALSCSSSSASRAMLASYSAASSDVASGSRLSSYGTTPRDSAIRQNMTLHRFLMNLRKILPVNTAKTVKTCLHVVENSA